MAGSSGEEAKSVTIVGGGLVGALEACYMAKRGYKVDMYEMRPDIRTMEVVRGRSINLALSTRGREALKRVGLGLEEEMVKQGIPMHARMIHDRDGTRRPIPYGKKDQYIMSIDRRHLNEILLTAAEKFPNVTLHFDHKVVDCDFDASTVVFQRNDGSKVSVTSDLIIGCDGAFSKIRQLMMKKTLFDYEQIFIPTGYMELNMPPTQADEYAMEINYLHIWARNEFMMIALPNLDKSFTVTLFTTFEMFKTLKTEADVMKFFQEHFPDSISLMGAKYLGEYVSQNKALPMVTVKCSPYHVKDKAVILGDAAHAMVPFYGQGMNCGFEDCLVLDDMLQKHKDDIGAALAEYSVHRSVDAKAMCDLAFYNYIEMRKSVNSKLFLLRKKLDNFLYWMFPRTWMPLYTSVSFSRTRYHQCIQNKQWQDQVIKNAIFYGVPTVAVAGYLTYRYAPPSNLNISSRLVDLVKDLRPTWM